MTKRDDKIGRLLDESRTPDDGWAVIDRYIIPPNATKAQRVEMRKAFEMGAMWVIAHAMEALSKHGPDALQGFILAQALSARDMIQQDTDDQETNS